MNGPPITDMPEPEAPRTFAPRPSAPTRDDVLSLAERYVCPDRVRTFAALGAGIVMGRREGYRISDVDGRSWLDLHLNGGVYNLGHRNPELIGVLVDALDELDIGNHHFPSVERALLAADLVERTPGMAYAVFASGGGEAIDLAIKSARRATGRRRVVSVAGAYHGHTGLALAAGDREAAEAFLSTGADDEFPQVPFDDLPALEAALAEAPTAAVILETIPATIGFPVPDADYLPGVRELCDRFGALYIADEVQTGLGRTGSLWAVQRAAVTPDILVTGKGLSGGLYPIAATLLSSRAGAWLEDDGWSNISTFGGSELGCRVARAVLALTTRPETTAGVDTLTATFANGLATIAARHPEWLVEVRQTGLVIGLRCAHPMGGMLMTRACYDAGIWAMFAGFDRSVLQFKPGLLMSQAEAGEALARLEAAIAGLLGTGILDDPGLVARMFSQVAPTPRANALPRRDATMSSTPAASTTPPAIPDRGQLLAVLASTERRLDPANPEAGGHVKVLAYGEISAALTTDELPGMVCKRMAGFPDDASVSAYLGLVDEYLTELAAAGVRVVPTEAIPIHRPGRPPVVYLVQQRMDAHTLGHKQLHATDDDGLATVMGQVLDSVALLSQSSAGRTDGVEVALDGQLSNWSFAAADPASEASTDAATPTSATRTSVTPTAGPPGPVLIDVGTPFIRRNGKHSLDARVVVAAAPPGIRAMLLRFVADSYQDDYFVPRTVAVDLLGNFHKEGAPQRIGTGLEVVNQWLATADFPGPRDPITSVEVAGYYRQDARLLGIFLQARRADRAIRTKVLRQDYDFLLPGRVAR